MNHWYLVHTKIRQEQIALENLERQGFCCFLPSMRVEKLRRGLLQSVIEPLFPRYLFIHLGSGDTARSWAPIRSTLGVSRLVTFGAVPAKVDHELVEALRRRSQSQQIEWRQFEAGDAVLVNHGPFVNLEAVFQMADGESRVMVLLEILSKPVQIAVPATSVRKLG